MVPWCGAPSPPPGIGPRPGAGIDPEPGPDNPRPHPGALFGCGWGGGAVYAGFICG
jgi:hypothetical protein